jgi:hypothetical protein
MDSFQRVLLCFVLAALTQPVLAATFYVGTCKAGGLTSISAAVAAVPAGSTVNVCPGTYAEQVEIDKSLTLQGITSGNGSNVVITVPAGGLTPTTSVLFGPTVSPQVWVTGGPVTLKNIVVDGTGGGCPGDGWLAGVFYASGSSGTINQVTVRNQTGGGCGLGIDAENGSSTLETITIKNSNVHDVDGQAVNVLFNLTGTVTSNYVSGGAAIVFDATGGSVTNNVVSGPIVGISVAGGLSAVSGNVVENSPVGMRIFTTAPVKSNKIVNSSFHGIELATNGVTVQSNTITQSGTGIEFSCNTGTVSGNTIQDATTGLDAVPAAFAGTNTFDSVVTNRTGGCP